MSDSTTQIPQVSQSAIQREATQNEVNNAASTAMLFARLATTTALTWAYQGGRYNGIQFANGTVSLTASNTNYVVVHLTTLAVTASTSNTNWNDATTYGRAYLVVTGASTITTYQDHRAGSLGILSATATGGPPSGAAGGDLTGTYPNPTVGANKVGVAKMAATQTDVFFGRDTAGAGAGEEITVAAAKTLLGLTGTNSGDQTITLTGDVTGTGTGSFAATIANDAVTNAKLANVATATFKGRTTAGTGDPEDLTATQATALLNTMVGDSGSGGTKGLAGAPASGDAAAGKFWSAAGTWLVPAGVGSSAMIVLAPAYATPLTVDLTAYSAYPIVVVNVGTLTGNIIFNITNGFDGQIIRARFTQDGTGSRIFTAGAALRFSTDTPSPTLTTTASKMDRLAFEWHAGAGKADLIAVNKGY